MFAEIFLKMVENNGWNNSFNTSSEENLYPLELVIPITIIYVLIFVTGVMGNILTCIVIARNKSMHTATNYYLFSLAISDMLLLVSGLPPEMYRIWSPETYIFGDFVCILQGFAAETSANATVLTITAFTMERYIAICHPFMSHKMSKLSRAVRYIIAIWVGALCLAAPQAILFGVEYELKSGMQYSRCTIVKDYFQHAFEISTFLFFVGPMTLITVLYVLIGVQLRKSKNMAIAKRESFMCGVNGEGGSGGVRRKSAAAQNRVIKMLIAVVAAFFICWAPFHAQRLFAVYLSNADGETHEMTIKIYMGLMYTSGILYFLSTTINPVLYHIMSNKFREAFRKTITDTCRSKKKHQFTCTYSILRRYPSSLRQLHRSVSDSADTKATTAEISLKNIVQPNTKATKLSTPILTTICKASPRTSFESQKVTINKNGCDPNERYLNILHFDMFNLFRNSKTQFKERICRHGSVEGSQTISNSSLQDVDEIDYKSSDLVRYMEEINKNI